jgi:hypothetical protein
VSLWEDESWSTLSVLVPCIMLFGSAYWMVAELLNS